MGRKSLEERQAEMRDRLVREKLNSIGERIVVDAVKHTPAEPLPPTLPNVTQNSSATRRRLSSKNLRLSHGSFPGCELILRLTML